MRTAIAVCTVLVLVAVATAFGQPGRAGVEPRRALRDPGPARQMGRSEDRIGRLEEEVLLLRRRLAELEAVRAKGTRAGSGRAPVARPETPSDEPRGDRRGAMMARGRLRGDRRGAMMARGRLRGDRRGAMMARGRFGGGWRGGPRGLRGRRAEPSERERPFRPDPGRGWAPRRR